MYPCDWQPDDALMTYVKSRQRVADHGEGHPALDAR